MSAKRIVKVCLVLLLLAALPGLTAVLAQEEAPAAMEKGESTVEIPWINNEHEPNNNKADAEEIEYGDSGEVHGGIINQSGDVDYWQIYVIWDANSRYYNHSHSPMLFDVDAQSSGSPANIKICLWSDDDIVLACSDDTDTPDPMLYYNLEVGRNYYLVVQNVGNAGGDNYKYNLLISVPLLVSAAAGGLGTGNVDGIPFQSGDILAWSHFSYRVGGHYETGEKWVMFFDLSDLGVNGNLVNLSAGWRNSDYLLVGFATKLSLPGISSQVTPWEVVVFDPTQIGPATSGTFQRWWNGKDQGLTTAAEKIDAIDWPTWEGYTRLFVSTAGAARVYGGPATTLKLADEDIGLWMNDPADEFMPRWSLFFDGSPAHWGGLAKKDIVAMSVIQSTSMDGFCDLCIEHYIVIQGTAVLNFGGYTLSVTQKDIVNFYYEEYEYPYDSDYDAYLAWHGPDHGWNYNIDAIQYYDRNDL